MITEVTAVNFDKEVTNNAGAVLVDFYTPDCSPCRMMVPILDELATERGANLKIVKVDVAENAQLATEYGVTAMPTFVLFQNGQPQKQIVGARSKKNMSAWIDARD